MSETKEYVLPRFGQTALRFTGTLLVSKSSKQHRGPGQNRWHEVDVYRTWAGRLVLAISFRTCWQGEDDREEAWVLADEPALERGLRDYDPTDTLQLAGYPDHPDFQAKQQRMLQDLGDRYLALVGEILGELSICEEVE